MYDWSALPRGARAAASVAGRARWSLDTEELPRQTSWGPYTSVAAGVSMAIAANGRTPIGQAVARLGKGSLRRNAKTRRIQRLLQE